MSVMWSVRFPEPLFTQLQDHLFRHDDDEHGAVIAAGVSTTGRGVRLLARDLFLAEDDVDYVPGERGYRMLTPRFVAQSSDYCARQGLAYLAVHNHPGSRGRVTFSRHDLASHERGYPALLDIVDAPVGALVFAEDALAGDIWLPNGDRVSIEQGVVVGPNLKYLLPQPLTAVAAVDPVYDRHARLFGDLGQWRLRQLKVGVIGAGGGGSLLLQMLAHLGVGYIVAVDYDRIELSNLPRIVGAGPEDVGSLKVDVAERVARLAQPGIRFEAINGDIRDMDVACQLRDADLLFLATDNLQSRLVFNALVHQYLIPGFQIGAKVRADPRTSEVDEVFAVARPVLPYPGGGCLHCARLIPAGRLQEETLTAEERRRQRYVDSEEVAEPSVITLNAIGAAYAANDALMMVTGLIEEGIPLRHTLVYPREQETYLVPTPANPRCLDCAGWERSRFGRGDTARLPCRGQVSSA